MSLRPHALESVPEETARVARAAFPKGNPYLLLRDTLGTIFQDDDFATCFPLDGQPGLPPWRLALVTIMQFREHLADRQAAEAVRARIDWKYLLGLALTDPGFDFSVLSEFRDRLLASSAADSIGFRGWWKTCVSNRMSPPLALYCVWSKQHRMGSQSHGTISRKEYLCAVR